MAKKKAEEAETPMEQAAQIGPRKLKALLRAADSAYKDQRSIAGTLGEKIAQAVEHDHLHKKAFATIRAMDRMTPEKLADYWDTLEYYFDVSGLAERAKSAPRLSLQPGKDDEEAEEGDDKVKPFPKPASVAAE